MVLKNIIECTGLHRNVQAGWTINKSIKRDPVFKVIGRRVGRCNSVDKVLMFNTQQQTNQHPCDARYLENRERKEGQKFKVILSYKGNLRPVFDI